MEDFVRRYHLHHGKPWSERRELIISRLITALWGVVTLIMAFFVGDIAGTVLEAINQIGSMANGSILAVFALGLLTTRTRGSGAITGLLGGIVVNGLFWLFVPSVSWLWWNVIGFAVTFGTGFGLGTLVEPRGRQHYGDHLKPDTLERSVSGFLRTEASIDWRRRSGILLVWFLLLILVLLALG